MTIKIGDLIRVPQLNIFHYGVVAEIKKDTVTSYWWAHDKNTALIKAFTVNDVGNPLSTAYAQVMDSPCHPLCGKIKIDDLVKIQVCSSTGIVDNRPWYGIVRDIKLNENGELLVKSFWCFTKEEVINTGPTINGYETIVKDVELIARPWDSKPLGATTPIPFCTCKSLLYGCSCSYSVFMKREDF